jgi:hypothetical protein
MSSRLYMLSLRSIEPIRKAIGSKDRALFDAFVGTGTEAVIMEPPPAQEPGSWNYLVEPLAEHLGLAPRRLPISDGDWKQIYVWADYRAIVDPFLTERAKKLIEYLDDGRPFVGSGLEHDGCSFGWLTAAEVTTLLGELTKIDAAKFDDELGQFHRELLAALQETADRKEDLFLGAS